MNGVATPTARRPARQPWHRLGIPLPWTAIFGLSVFAAVIVCGALAETIAPNDPTGQTLSERLLPPLSSSADGSIRLLGTDALGRDICSRIIYGARVSLIIGLAATAGQFAFGTLLGLIAGYSRGAWDVIIMYLVDMQLTIPFLALAIAVAAVLGPSLPNVIIVLVVTNWVFFARSVRGEVLSVRERNFVEAAHSLGARNSRIIFRHILPNVANSILVLASFQMARTIVSEATLSFLGLGVQPPTPTWGNMVADGRDYVSSAWWVSTIPGFAISFFVLAANLLGNWIRDILDPMRRRRA